MKRIAAFATALLLVLPGCGIYTFSGKMASHLETVAIPIFENRTAEFGLGEQITDAIVDEFTRDGTLRIRDLRNADSAIFGTITRIQDAPATFTSGETVEEYRVTIGIHVRYEDLVKGKTVWEETWTQFGEYPFSGGSRAQREQGLEEATDKIAQDVLNKTVSGW